jgi:hypothetical protein
MMLPFFLRIKIKKNVNKGFSLFLPIFLVYILLLPIIIIFIPIYFIAVIIFNELKILLMTKYLLEIIVSLAGTKIHIIEKDSEIFLNFI